MDRVRKRRALSSGLLLTIFERFKVYVTERVDGFFSEHAEIVHGELRFTRSDKFKQLIKEKGVGGIGQHGNKSFRASLHWFYDLDAITKEELEEVERIYSLRNEIGHELLRIIADDDKRPISLRDVLITFGVYVKIVRWWVKEVEATIDPEFDQEKYKTTNWDEVDSVETVFLREIICKALVGNAEWEQFEEMVRNE